MIVNQDQAVRSRCLFYLRVDNVVKSQITFYGIQEANGFELLKLLREFSLLSRSEATTVGRRAIYCKGPPECKHCGKTGHLAKDCRRKIQVRSQQQLQRNERTKIKLFEAVVCSTCGLTTS